MHFTYKARVILCPTSSYVDSVSSHLHQNDAHAAVTTSLEPLYKVA